MGYQIYFFFTVAAAIQASLPALNSCLFFHKSFYGVLHDGIAHAQIRTAFHCNLRETVHTESFKYGQTTKTVFQQTRSPRFPENTILLKAKKGCSQFLIFNFALDSSVEKNPMKEGIGGGGGIIIGPNLHFRWVCFERRGGTDDDPLQGFFFRFLWWMEEGVGRRGRRLKGLLQVFAFPCAVEDWRKEGGKKMQKVVGGNKISRIIALLYTATYNSIQN